MKESTDERRNLEAAAAGDVRAWEPLVERYFGLVHAIGYARLGDREAAEDLAQEVFLRAYLHLRDGGDLPRRFSAWLSAAARNLATDWLRRRQRRSRLAPMIPLEAAPSEPADTGAKGAREMMIDAETNRAVRAAIGALSPEEREVILLHYTQRWSKKQIAERLGVHGSTVGRRLDRALASMRSSLDPILRESIASLRPRSGAAAGAIGLIGAAAALPSAALARLTEAARGGPASRIPAIGSPSTAGVIPDASALAAVARILTGGGIMGSKMAWGLILGTSLVVGGLVLVDRAGQVPSAATAVDTAATPPPEAQVAAAVEAAPISADDALAQASFASTALAGIRVKLDAIDEVAYVMDLISLLPDGRQMAYIEERAWRRSGQFRSRILQTEHWLRDMNGTNYTTVVNGDTMLRLTQNAAGSGQMQAERLSNGPNGSRRLPQREIERIIRETEAPRYDRYDLARMRAAGIDGGLELAQMGLLVRPFDVLRCDPGSIELARAEADVWVFHAKPRDSVPMIAALEITIGRDDAILRKVEYFDDAGKMTSRITLSRVRIAPGFDESEFTIPIPPGVDVTDGTEGMILGLIQLKSMWRPPTAPKT